MEIATPVQVAIVTGAFGMGATALGLLAKRLDAAKKDNTDLHADLDRVTAEQDAAEAELQNIAQLLSADDFIPMWESFKPKIKRLEEITPVDRVLMFKALNGISAPQRTSCFYQSRSTDQEESEFVYYPIDDTYRALMSRVERDGLVYVRASEMPENDQLARIYRAEGVKASAIAFIARKLGATPGSVVVIYWSMASHTVSDFSPQDKLHIETLAAELRHTVTGE